MKIERNTIYHQDCLEGIKQLPNDSVDCICTDPPYLYLKGQKLERPFDEMELFKQWKRVLKKGGFVVLFGRGTSFYRWNTMIADLGFKFKEEIVWDKNHSTSPLMAVSRVHETISIFSKGKGAINRVKVPYLEMKGHDLGAITQDIKRIKSVLNNTKSLNAVLNYLENNQKFLDRHYVDKHTVSIQPGVKQVDKVAAVFSAVENGMSEKSIVRSDFEYSNSYSRHNVSKSRTEVPTGDRSANVIQGITQGMNEKTIIKQTRDHYATIHPTQKPVRLLERLLALVSKPGDVVLDPFSGSGSTAIACINTDRRYIGFEIDEEYYKASVERIDECLETRKTDQLSLFQP